MYQTTQETGRFHNASSSFELRCGAYVRVKSAGHFGIVVRSRPAGVNCFVNLVKTCEPVPQLHPVYEFAESQALQAIA
jgi:hypothetical protein